MTTALPNELRLVEVTAPVSPSELVLRLAQHAAFGRRIGRLLGMTTTWASTRWIPGAHGDQVVASFQIRVCGECPDRAMGEVVIRTLASRGWAGRLVADGVSFRVDAKKSEAEVLLSAFDRTITLTVRGAPVTLSTQQVRLLLAGVYEDDFAA